MRAPYRTWLLMCPPVVGAGFEPRSSDQEFDPLHSIKSQVFGRTRQLNFPEYTIMRRFRDTELPKEQNNKKIEGYALLFVQGV